MEELQEAARQMVDNILQEGNIAEMVKKCISYERMAAYLSLSRQYVIGSGGIYEYCG